MGEEEWKRRKVERDGFYFGAEGTARGSGLAGTMPSVALLHHPYLHIQPAGKSKRGRRGWQGLIRSCCYFRLEETEGESQRTGGVQAARHGGKNGRGI